MLFTYLYIATNLQTKDDRYLRQSGTYPEMRLPVHWTGKKYYGRVKIMLDGLLDGCVTS